MGSAFSLEVIADRNSYGRVDAMCGDSLIRGFGLGAFEDAVDPGDPLYRFRSIEATLNWALEINGRSERVMWLTNFDQASIVGFINSGIIRSTDRVLCEDAADPSLNTSDYHGKWKGTADAVVALDRDFVGMTMFDYPVGGLGSQPENQFDRVRFTDADDKGTLNGAIRRALTSTFNPRVRLIDMNLHMDTFRRLCRVNDNVRVMLDDDVHVNVWGQTRMAGLIAQELELLPFITDLDEIQDVAEANFEDLAYGSETFDGPRARDYVSLCFAPC